MKILPRLCRPCGKISWRYPAPDQTVWFPVLALTMRPGLWGWPEL